MRWALVAAGALAASTLVVSWGVDASADPTFGQAGELAVSWDQPLVAGSYVAINPALGQPAPQPMALTPIGFQYYSVSDNGGSDTLFDLAPAADYFVIDDLSLGAQVMFGIASSSPSQGNGTTTTLYGVAPQVGYNLVLSDSISFWPKVFFAFAGTSESNNGPSTSSGTLGVFAPFLFHITSHFYAGAGPDFSTQLFVNESNNAPAGMGNVNVTPPKVTTFGAMGTFGGWFDLGG